MPRGLTALRPILDTGYIPSKVGRATLGISGTALPAVNGRLRPLTVGAVGCAASRGAIWRLNQKPSGPA